MENVAATDGDDIWRGYGSNKRNQGWVNQTGFRGNNHGRRGNNRNNDWDQNGKRNRDASSDSESPRNVNAYEDEIFNHDGTPANIRSPNRKKNRQDNERKNRDRSRSPSLRSNATGACEDRSRDKTRK